MLDDTTIRRTNWRQETCADGRVAVVHRGDSRAESGGRIQIVGFPAAGGGVAPLKAVAAALPPAFSVSIVEGPGHTLTKGPPLRDIESVVEVYRHLLRLEPAGCLLVGHSFGAAIAFELACRWEEEGAACLGVVIAACCAPGSPMDRLAHLADHELIDWLLHARGSSVTSAAERRGVSFVLDGLRADLEALENYRIRRRLQTPILVVAGRNDPLCTPKRARAWREHGDDVEICALTGDHFFPQRDPERLASLIAGFAERARAHGGP